MRRRDLLAALAIALSACRGGDVGAPPLASSSAPVAPPSSASGPSAAVPPAPSVEQPLPAGVQRLAVVDGEPKEIAVYGGEVFWIAGERVMKVSAAGGPVAVVDATFDPHDITADRAGVYWLAYQRVMMFDAARGKRELHREARSILSGVAADADSVYWGQAQPEGLLVKIGRSDGGFDILAALKHEPHVIAVIENDIHYATKTSNATGRPLAQELRRAPKERRGCCTDTSSRVTSWTGRARPVVNRDGACVGDETSREVRCLQWGAGSTSIASPGAPVALALDGSDVLWCTGEALLRATRRGGRGEELVRQEGIVALTADAESVYWLGRDGVMKRPKK